MKQTEIDKAWFAVCESTFDRSDPGNSRSHLMVSPAAWRRLRKELVEVFERPPALLPDGRINIHGHVVVLDENQETPYVVRRLPTPGVPVHA